MNSQSQMLMLHEIAALKADPAFPKRLLSSYRMMLDFYGMQLADPKTGRVVRGANYRARYAHLNRSTHNYLRITRILKCLGELGQEHLKLGFLLLIVREITLNELKPASVGRSAVNYCQLNSVHTMSAAAVDRSDRLILTASLPVFFRACCAQGSPRFVPRLIALVSNL